MNKTAAATRRREQVEHLCAAAIRALTGRPGLRFRAGRLHDGPEPVHAAASHLRTDPGLDFASSRGVADGLALRLEHSDPELHRGLRPEGEMAQLVFELLEQFRVEALADPGRPGIATNVRHRHETWSHAVAASGLLETMEGLLLYTVAQVGRSKVTNEPVVAATEDHLEATRFGLAPHIGSDLALLRRLRHQQADYAQPALRMAKTVQELLRAEAGHDSARTSTSKGGALRDTFALLLDDSESDAEPVPGAAGLAERGVTGTAGYQVFTRSYDRQLPMSALCRPDQLRRLRERLDVLVDDSSVNARRLGRQLHAVFATQRPRGWDTAQEEGLVDSGRLSRLVTNASDARVFRTPTNEPSAEAQVTLLLDCSGSMRRYQERIAVLVDVLVRALDLAGVDTEVLGYTTAAWNGGRAMKDWRRDGRHAQPGRLNERLHLVVKDADEPWRRARRQLAGLLRGDYFREALDGEAVEWATARLRERPDLRHRILLVLSDGSPMDSATALVNGSEYLDRHLSNVLDRIDGEGQVRVVGIGVGLDLSGYYRHGHVLDLDRPVDSRTMREVVGMLDRAARPS